jgi:HrpA-like RNA helicase
MTEQSFDYKKYRRELAKTIREEIDRQKRREILESAKRTEEYQRAKILHQKERERLIREKESELPILKYAEIIKETVASNQTVIIVGETGSGKTTQIPLILREVISPKDKIVVTQPRRVAAISVARYVAEKVGCKIGEEVGYRIRFEDRTTEGTLINFMTDGILLRIIQEDPLLRDYSVVMIDEAHERSINIDFILGLLKLVQRRRAEAGLPPLKIIISSATLEKEKLAKYFVNAPIVEIPGRLYPVKIHYEKEPVSDYIKAAAEKVKMIVEQGKEGDILIFMPGKEEIYKTIREIEALNLPGIVILPLHGELSPEEQIKVFEKTRERKVIVATNIAETSVTVPGVRYVIDTGLIKQIEFNPLTGIEALVTRPHAKSGCTQRTGRAGREAPGECWRLYTESDFNNRPEFQTPEIQRSNLAHVVLMMKAIGIEDVESFEFIDPPDKEALKQAIETLKALGALDENERITKIGEIMADLPLEPHIARMVVEAEKYNCVREICTIASFLGGRSVFVRPQGKESKADKAHERFKVPGSDFLTLLKVWEEYEQNHYNDDWARNNFLNPKVLEEVRQIRYQLFRILKEHNIPVVSSKDPEVIAKSVAAGLIESLMELQTHHAYRRVKDSEIGFFIHRSSVTFGSDSKPEFLVAAEVVQTEEKGKKYCNFIQVVKPEWLFEIAPHLIREEESKMAYYDPTKGIVVRKVYLYLKGSHRGALKEEERPVTVKEATEIFAEALALGRIDLPFVKHNKQVMEIIEDLWKRTEGKSVQRFSLDDLKNFYFQRLDEISSLQELKEVLQEGRINLELNLDELVSPELREEILRDNPDSINILGIDRPVRYDYDSFYRKFSAVVRIPAADVLRLKEIPRLPSGRVITLEVVSQEGETSPQFSGTDLNELKQKSRQLLIKKQWNEWRYSQMAPRDQVLESFDPLGGLPKLPEPIKYGFDPETSDPLFAYPAIIRSGNKFLIRYFPSKEEAEKAQREVLEIIEQARAKKLKKEERERLLAPIQELAQRVKQALDTIEFIYREYGLSREERDDLFERFWKAKRMIESNPQEANRILQKIDERLNQAFEYKKQRQLAKEKAEAAIKEYYSSCPLCGKPLENLMCINSEHNPDLIDFPTDEKGNEIGPAILSQIVTDKGEIVAQLCVSHEDRPPRFYRGDVYVRMGSEVDGGWQGEPFKSLTFQDFGKILTPEQAQRRKEEREKRKAWARYNEELDYAKKQVEQGIWKKGKFSRGKHPKTGEEQWELTIKRGNLFIKYVVDRRSRQPTNEENTYFFSEVRTIVDKVNVDTGKFRLILVKLEPPFPEDKPEEPQTSS